MRFDDEYRKDMNQKTLSEDFIKNLAAKMADESEKCQKQNEYTDTDNVETIETRAVEYKRNTAAYTIRITAAAAAVASVMIVSGILLKNIPDANQSVTPVLTETVTVTESAAITETVISAEKAQITEAVSSFSETTGTAITDITEVTYTEQTADVTSENITEETTAENTDEEEINPENTDDKIFTENAREIFEAFNTADSMRVGYGIETSNRPAFGFHVSDNEPDYEYIYVTDERFRSLKDVSDFLDMYFTPDIIQNRFALILTHIFREQDDGLYVTQTPTSYGYQWSSDEIKIQDKTENSFTMSRTYYDFGAESELILNMIKSDSYPGWKISSVKFSLLN